MRDIPLYMLILLSGIFLMIGITVFTENCYATETEDNPIKCVSTTKDAGQAPSEKTDI